jgi:hypothetical protein
MLIVFASKSMSVQRSPHSSPRRRPTSAMPHVVLDVELEASNLHEELRLGLSWAVEEEAVDHDRRAEPQIGCAECPRTVLYRPTDEARSPKKGAE